MTGRYLAAVIGLVFIASCTSDGPAMNHYTVQRGDTLFVIGKAHGVSVEQLKQWNNLDSDLIEVGQVLVVGAGTPLDGRQAIVHSSS